jgi:hypothetical protein
MFEVVYTVVSIQLPVIYRFLLSKEPLYVKTLNLCLIYHFSPFENENYHRFIIVLQAINLTSLSPYATDLTSDQSLAHVLRFINIKRVSVTYKCYEMYAHWEKKVQLLDVLRSIKKWMPSY